MIIGISGKKNSGKDLAGEIIREFDQSYRVVKYADKLKDIVCLLIGCTREQLEDRDFKESPLGEEWWIIECMFKENSGVVKKILPYKDRDSIVSGKYDNIMSFETIKVTPRWLLQYIGTECFRQIIHPNTWVNATYAGINDGDNVVITDVRFPNEADAVKEHGGIVIRISRPVTDKVSDNHVSETALDNYDFDYIINNDGSIDDFRQKIMLVIKK